MGEQLAKQIVEIRAIYLSKNYEERKLSLVVIGDRFEDDTRVSISNEMSGKVRIYSRHAFCSILVLLLKLFENYT